MSFSRWSINNADENAIKKLCGELGIPTLQARVLAARGYSTPELARDFFGDGDALEDPLSIKDMDRAAERINAAIQNEERIAVFGDYDVDGITATALMWLFLQGCGADVVCSLPTRDTTGYGISKEAIDNLNKYGVSLIITVDNGISSYNEVEYAKTLGIDVVVTDHHLPPEQLPDAVAVVDPLREDDTSTFKEFAGVGIALKLAAAIDGCTVDEMLDYYGYLAAIGTVADVMPLVGQNRTIVKAGMAGLGECEAAGLMTLAQARGLDLSSISAQDIAFTIAPSLNAAGRMGDADLALRLLICDDFDEAEKIADQLIELNSKRREIEADIIKDIDKILKANSGIIKKPIIIIDSENLHSGVVGIVCSRLSEKYGKPVIIISVEGGDAKGSGRSIEGFSLHAAITSCGDLLTKFGGHEMAAGFTMNAQDVAELKRRLFDYCTNAEEGMPYPEFRVDALVNFSEVNIESVESLMSLAPFGCSNDEPVFAAKGLVVSDAVPMSEKHTKLTLKQGTETLTGAVFGKAPGQLGFKPGDTVDAAFTLSIYETPAKRYVSVNYRDVRRSGISDESFASIKAYNDMCAGRALTEEQRISIAPSRDDIAYVYKLLKSEAVKRLDYFAISSMFEKLAMGKVSAALDVLEELELIEQLPGDGTHVLRATENPQKRELSESKTFNLISNPQLIDA